MQTLQLVATFPQVLWTALLQWAALQETELWDQSLCSVAALGLQL